MDENQLVEAPVPTAEEQAPEPAPQPVDTAPDSSSLKSEIEKLNEAREKARKDAEYWRREKAQARADYFKSRQDPGAGYTPPPVVPQPGEPKPPAQEDFDDYRKYQEAHSKFVQDLVDYRTTQKLRAWEQESAQRNAQQAYQQKVMEVREKLNRGFEKYEDFEEVALAETVPISNVVMDAMAESENPEDVAYYLGRNRAEALQISRMTPAAAGRAIARIEMAIKQNPPSQLNPLRRVTNAPPPVRPVGGSNTVSKDLDKMSQREFEAEMEKRTGRRF